MAGSKRMNNSHYGALATEAISLDLENSFRCVIFSFHCLSKFKTMPSIINTKTILWLSVAVLLSLPVYRLSKVFGFDIPPIIPFLHVLAIWVITVCHSLIKIGRFNTLLFYSVAIIVSGAAEILGTSFGLVFGSYAYQQSVWMIGSKLPVTIPLIWSLIAYGGLYISYFAWSVAGIRPEVHKWGRALVAACFLTTWDLVVDPLMVAWGGWQWSGKGAYFGIPLSNFAGWFATAITIYLLYHWFEKDGEIRIEEMDFLSWSPVITVLIIYGINVVGCLQFDLAGPAMVGLMGFCFYCGIAFWRALRAC